MILSPALPLFLLATGIHAAASSEAHRPRASSSFDCKNIKAGSYQFDLSSINFPVLIETHVKTPPTTTRTAIAIDLCAALEQDNGPTAEQCAKGTRICMKVINDKKGEGERVTQVISAAGGTEGGGGGGVDRHDEWSVSLGEHLEGAERTLEWEMQGSYYGEHKQRTSIDFKCDKKAPKDAVPTMKKYDALDGKLKLEWRTPHACATHMGGAGDKDDSTHNGGDAGRGKDGSDAQGGWGVFSWFFFFVIVGAVVYFAAGLWRNYNEYGVIELPNKDFWREAPYIAKDMGRHIYSTVSGQGSSRGAYEPV